MVLKTRKLNTPHHQATIDCYNQQADEYGARFLSLDTKEHCQRFLGFLPEEAHILDAGCGPGRDTKYFLDNGYHVTAFDAAEEFVKQARAHTNHPILHMSFDYVTFKEEFDGVWAMASLLHLSREECFEVFQKNLVPALKLQGVLYCCFLEGEGERMARGRYFMDYTEEALRALFNQLETVTILDIWVQEDQAPDRKGRNWVNGLVRKRIG